MDQMKAASDTKAALEAELAELQQAIDQNSDLRAQASVNVETKRTQVKKRREEPDMQDAPTSTMAEAKSKKSEGGASGLNDPASTRVGRVRDQMLMQVLGHIPQDEEM